MTEGGTELRDVVEDFYFTPTGMSAEEMQVFADGKGMGDKIKKLDEFLKALRKRIKDSGIAKWEVTVEGTLETSTGFLPGGKAGFKTTIKIMSD
ncbi:MAG: hypothetical protein JSV94_03465 [Methanobacteriota archaeon]|nr:MAG: hypothetical protein JSV94_03465 [Euryarchaeota archaeon]